MTPAVGELREPLVPEYRNDDFRRGFIEFLPERIYFQSGLYMYCLDSEGALIFKYEIDAPSRSSPSIRSDKYIYFGDGAGNLYILKPNGELLKKLYLSPVYSTSLDITPYINEKEEKIYVTRDKFWECDLGLSECIGILKDIHSYSSPTAKGRIAYAGFDDGWFYEMDFETMSSSSVAISGAGAIRCSPIKEDRRVWWVSYNGYFVYFDFEKYDYVYFSLGIHTNSTMARHGDCYYIPSHECFYTCRMIGTSRLVTQWRRDDINSDWSSPALFLSDGVQYIFIGATDFYLYALKGDGSDVYVFKTGDAVESSPLVDCSANAYFGSNDGYFYAVGISGNLIFKYQTEDAVRASPSLQKSDRTIVEGIEYIVREGVRLPLVKKGDIIKSEHHNNQVIFIKDIILKYLPPSYKHVKL